MLPLSRESLVALSIALSYLCFVFSRVYIAVVAPALQYDDERLDYNVEKHSHLLVICGLTYGVSKLINGAIVDSLNPKHCYSVFISLSAACTLALSYVHEIVPDELGQSSKYYFILGVAAVNSYAQAGGWPALSKYIYYTSTPDQYGKIFSALSIGSRFGSILVSIIVGTALTHMNWQGAVKIVALITMLGLPMLWVTESLRPMPDSVKMGLVHAYRPSNDRPLIQKCCDKTRVYCSWFCDRNFVFSLLSFGLLGLLASFELFLPLFLKTTINPPSSVAAFMTAVLPAGVATSIVFGSVFIEICPYTVRGAAVLVMLFLMFLCTVCIGFFTVSLNAGATQELYAQTTILMLLFSYGLFLGYPYYVPPSLYALEYGGEDAAMVMSMVDTITAIFSAAFATFGAKLASESWVLPISILAICSMIAFWLQFVNYFTDNRPKQVRTKKLNPSSPSTQGATVYLGAQPAKWDPMII